MAELFGSLFAALICSEKHHEHVESYLSTQQLHN